MPVSIIVAHSKNRVIGNDNTIPWYLREDMQFFKRSTIGKIVIMGRKTYESIPEKHRPLIARITYILTRDKNYIVDHPDVKVFHDFKKALMMAKLTENEIMIAGGGEIYEQALPYTDIIYATILEHEFEGTVFFPEISEDDWNITDSIEDFYDTTLKLYYRRFIYQRKR